MLTASVTGRIENKTIKSFEPTIPRPRPRADRRSPLSGMTIRLATVDDAERVVVLMKSVQGVWQRGWRPDSVQRSIAAADGLAFVATNADAIIGFVSGHDLGFRGYLSELVVAERHQRTGVGSALLKAFERALADRHCRLVIADVYPPAAAFYAARGWKSSRAVLLARRLRAAKAP